MIVLNKWMFSAVTTTAMAVIASSALGVYLNIKKHAHVVVSADNRKAENASNVRTLGRAPLAHALIKDASPDSVSKDNASNSNTASAAVAFSYLASNDESTDQSNGSKSGSSFHFVPELMAKNYADNDSTHNSRNARSVSTSVSEVPEPATYTLLVGGLAMMFFLSRRRKIR